MSERIGEFAEFLKARGLKIGRARMTIAEVILGAKHHLTPSEIFVEARKRMPSIGLVTVYRTVSLLREAKLITESKFNQQAEAYIEPMRGRPHHDHLFCIRCREIVEFMNDAIERLQEKVAREHGYEITHHSLMIWGVCARCRNARKPVQRRRDERVRIRLY